MGSERRDWSYKRRSIDLLDEFPNGIVLVELGSIVDASLVPHAAATALGLRGPTTESIQEILIERLRGRQVLLLLDNCEHLVAACAELTYALLRACPSLRVLATSREPLRVDGEIAWRVPSLSVPDLGQPRTANQPPSESDAVRLFVERASAAQRGFTLTNRNATQVVGICARLDGIPLAIELAAAQTPILSPEQIAAQLDDRFRLLTVATRTAPPRQRTLRAAVDWSYQLLSEPEGLLLERLSVFTGSTNLEAIQEVCTGDEIHSPEIIALLGMLISKSLVMADLTDHGAQRYRLLETIREYGRERLAERGWIARIRQRHADYFVELGEQASR